MRIKLVHVYGYGMSRMGTVISWMIEIGKKKFAKGRLPDVPICVNIMVLNRL